LPDWVDHQPYRAEIPDTEVSCVAGGIRRLLNDVQVNLGLPEQAWHCWTVQRVLTREGAERIAHVVVEFDPGYQRIEVHFVRVVREGDVIDHARPEAFQILRRETNMERLIFDGVLTASLLIPDVRINDIVEIAVTVHGSVPVLSGRYVAWAAFDSFSPWFDARHRLVKPRARHLVVKEYNGPPEQTAVVESEDLRWQLVGQQRSEPEPLAPPWLVQRPCLQFSEFESWAEVACLLEPHYVQDILPEALAQEVDRLALAHQAPAERAAEWLRFVQRELRYFAISLGEGGLTPRTLDSIWSTRFGDCKDAAALYVAGARRLGLEACPALVSTTHGFALKDFIPSSGVFNHCIVRLSLDGNRYWLDPTMPVQSGTLRNVFQPHVGWALPLTPQTTGLEKLGDREPLHVLHGEDDVTLGPKRASPAVMRRRIDFSSWAADSIRHRIANEGSQSCALAMLKELQSACPGAVQLQPMEVHDDATENKITLTLTYEIHDCWKASGNGSKLDFIVSRGMGRELQPLSAVRRATDIYLDRPRRLTSYARLNMPCKWFGDGWLRRIETSDLTYVDHFRVDGRTIINSRELVTGAWSLSAKETEVYNDVAKKLQGDLLVIGARELFGRIRPQRPIIALLGIGIGRVLTAVWAVWLLIFVLRILFAPR
jgi:transglutaminase-like putative cysteine protease